MTIESGDVLDAASLNTPLATLVGRFNALKASDLTRRGFGPDHLPFPSLTLANNPAVSPFTMDGSPDTFANGVGVTGTTSIGLQDFTVFDTTTGTNPPYGWPGPRSNGAGWRVLAHNQDPTKAAEVVVGTTPRTIGDHGFQALQIEGHVGFGPMPAGSAYSNSHYGAVLLAIGYKDSSGTHHVIENSIGIHAFGNIENQQVPVGFVMTASEFPTEVLDTIFVAIATEQRPAPLHLSGSVPQNCGVGVDVRVRSFVLNVLPLYAGTL